MSAAILAAGAAATILPLTLGLATGIGSSPDVSGKTGAFLLSALFTLMAWPIVFVAFFSGILTGGLIVFAVLSRTRLINLWTSSLVGFLLSGLTAGLIVGFDFEAGLELALPIAVAGAAGGFVFLKVFRAAEEY